MLDLGCGIHKYKSDNPKDKVIGLDRLSMEGVNVVWDMEKTPLPFDNNEFDIIIAKNCLEHVFNLTKLLEDCHRILKPNGIFKIWVPHYSGTSAFMNPEHIRYFSIRTFDIYYPDYGPVKHWTVKKKRINYVPEEATNSLMKFLDKIITPIVNINPVFYEKFLSGLIPCDECYFELMKKK